MGGRLEKEIKARESMEVRLNTLPPIFSEFYHWLDARERSYTTMKNYINHVVEFMNFYTKNKRKDDFYLYVTDIDIEKYLTSLRRKVVDGKEVELGDSIRATKWSSLNTFFKFLSNRKYIETNPMVLTERPKLRTENEVVYLTQDEIESVFKRITSESKDVFKNRDLCIVAMGLGTGLRVSAIVNIDIEDIDFSTNTIRVIEKGRKIRQIKFANNLRNALLAWIKDREIYFDGGTEGPLFLSQKKTRMAINTVLNLVKKYTSHLSKHITPHKLRSSAAMNLHGAGVDILTIASILGHENITTTQRYTRAFDEDKKEATNILDSLI